VSAWGEKKSSTSRWRGGDRTKSKRVWGASQKPGELEIKRWQTRLELECEVERLPERHPRWWKPFKTGILLYQEGLTS